MGNETLRENFDTFRVSPFNGYGYGDGYGNGNGNGDGYGDGNGHGDGDGYGDDGTSIRESGRQKLPNRQ